jgi:hypothetical protein
VARLATPTLSRVASNVREETCAPTNDTPLARSNRGAARRNGRRERADWRVQPIGNRQQKFDQVVGADLGRPMPLVNFALYRCRDFSNGFDIRPEINNISDMRN